MADLVQDDTGPDLVVTLTKASGGPVDLTDAAVYFQMRKPDDRRYTVNSLCDIVGDPTLGKVNYSWGPNDLAVWGTYDAQWEVQFPDGKVITTKEPLTLEVRRQ